jgi:hypothetical protein
MKNFLVISLLGVVMLALPHSSRAAGPRDIAGYFDPTTSRFVHMVTAKVVPQKDPVTRTGTVVLDLTLSIESDIGVDESVSCSASIFGDDASFFNQVDTGGNLTGRPTGTVTLAMPYNWTMAASGETATFAVGCSEGDGENVEHSMTFAGGAFVVPTAPGTVTTEKLTGSL